MAVAIDDLLPVQPELQEQGKGWYGDMDLGGARSANSPKHGKRRGEHPSLPAPSKKSNPTGRSVP